MVRSNQVSADKNTDLKPAAFELSVTNTGNGIGTIDRTPNEVAYVNGQVVTLTATPQAGSIFIRWMNNAVGTDRVCEVKMDAAKWVFAEFVLDKSVPSQTTTSAFSLPLEKLQQIETRRPTQVELADMPLSDLQSSAGASEQKDSQSVQNSKWPHFIDHGDGTVTDKRSGLMWMRAAVGQGWNFNSCTGDASRISLQLALKIRSNFAGYANWRLPTVDELKGLIQRDGKAPTINIDVFPNTPKNYFWTSSPDAEDVRYTWRVDFSVGTINGDLPDEKSCVRLVRFLPSFTVTSAIRGLGSGSISCRLISAHENDSLEVDSYAVNSVVTLTAHPSVGSKFKCWHGDATGLDDSCTVTMDALKNITAEFEKLKYFELLVELKGTGSGVIARSPKDEKHLQGSIVKLSARPATGSEFVCWHGDVIARGADCTVTMDSAKSVFAEFVEIETFTLDVTATGDGNGKISRSLDAEKYTLGTEITLTATAHEGSKFVGWHGDVTALGADCTITMNSVKSVSAEFAIIESFVLACTREGCGDGSVNWAVQSGSVINTTEGAMFFEGSVIELTAIPLTGSKFRCWFGDAAGTLPNCTVTFDSAKSVVAAFDALETFTLTVETNGGGEGSVQCNPEESGYFSGSNVKLSAIAAAGSTFIGWHGDATGLDDSCTVKMTSAKSVTAEFEKVCVADLGVMVEFESAKHASMKGGNATIIFYLNIRNKGEKQVRITLPLATYVNQLGEEIEQDVWLSGLVIGAEGATIRAGTFRKIGLVFDKSRLSGLSKGEYLFVTVEQIKPSVIINFTFRCTHAGACEFELIKAISVDKQALADESENLPAMANILQRLELLERGMAQVLLKLDALQDGHPLPKGDAFSKELPAPSLVDVLRWLSTQVSTSIADLRIKLLPLDLLPSAVVDDVNERALDLTGEAALEDDGTTVVVQQAVLLQVIAQWPC